MTERLLALGYQRCDDTVTRHGDCLCTVDHEVHVFGWKHSRELCCHNANGVGRTLRLPNSQDRPFPRLNRSASPRLQSMWQTAARADLLPIIFWAFSRRRSRFSAFLLGQHTVHVAGDVCQFRGILVCPDKLTSFFHQHYEHCGVQRPPHSRTKCTSSSSRPCLWPACRKERRPKKFAVPADSTSLSFARLARDRLCKDVCEFGELRAHKLEILQLRLKLLQVLQGFACRTPPSSCPSTWRHGLGIP